MGRPKSLPQKWATDLNYSSGDDIGTPIKVVPSAGKVAQAWQPKEKPASQHMNQNLHAAGAWTDYIKDFDWLNLDQVDPILPGAGDTFGGSMLACAFRPTRALPSDTPDVGQWYGILSNDESASSAAGRWWASRETFVNTVTHPKSLIYSQVASLWIIGFESAAAAEIKTKANVNNVGVTRTDPGAAANHNGMAEDVGGGIIVMARSVGGFITSADGITWVERTHPAAEKNIRSVCRSTALSLFCAVGANDTILTSADGITWVERTSSGAHTGETFEDVVFDEENGFFVLVGSNGAMERSADGVTWSDVQPASGWGAIDLISLTVFGALVIGCSLTEVVVSFDGGLTWDFIGPNGPSMNGIVAGNRVIGFGNGSTNRFGLWTGLRFER